MENQNPQNGLPEVRQLPFWKASDKIILNGLEWEAIFNLINNFQDAFMAMNNIMNRHVLEGTIQMKFEKLENGQYVAMTPEEEAPHQQQFQDVLSQAKELAEKAVAEQQERDLAESQKEMPSLSAITGGKEEGLLL